MSDCKQKYIEWSSENDGWYCGEYDNGLCGIEARAEFGGWEAAWNARQSEIDQLKAEKEKLEIELSETKHVYRNVVDMELAKVEKLKAEKAGFKNLVKSLRSEFDLNGGSEQVERQIELLEEAVRGEHE